MRMRATIPGGEIEGWGGRVQQDNAPQSRWPKGSGAVGSALWCAVSVCGPIQSLRRLGFRIALVTLPVCLPRDPGFGRSALRGMELIHLATVGIQLMIAKVERNFPFIAIHLDDLRCDIITPQFELFFHAHVGVHFADVDQAFHVPSIR